MKNAFNFPSVVTGAKFRKKLAVQTLAIGLLFGATALQAQKKTTHVDTVNEVVDTYQPFSFGLQVKNMHLWHGFVVTPGPMVATNLEFNSRDKKFTFGFWGGAGAASDVTNKKTGADVGANYKEFSIYTAYHFNDKFFIEAVTHNNYTGVEERGDVLHYWSYNKRQGYNFVDLNFGYQVTKSTSLYLATILGGGSGDYQVQADGSLRDSYTQYLEIKSKVFEKGDTKLNLFVGGAWSLVNEKTFYTQGKGNIINVGATLSKKVALGSYVLPVDVTAMWNPEKQKTVLQVAAKLF
ncbi:hypothetical protein FFWV33_03240 [Flavobacterium faecale]|uniref:Phenol degradation protein meta n=1 Tax=Flavobacterium faecale TaxID=1355330 RepID=A0A2S1LA30_9FLAO|nr:hypothetical protein [Flavobacterium faecale]AWG20620.1 hypothetical protein FFWV33_03240 [Flavobacterium faecale]